MKILNVLITLDPKYGGPVEGLRQQCLATAGLAERAVVCLDDPSAPWIREFPATVYALGRYSGPLPFIGRYGYCKHLTKWLHEHAASFDCIVTHGLWNYTAVAASRALPGSGVPYFSFVHGMMDPWFRRHYPIKHIGKMISWALFEGPLLAGARKVLFTAEEEKSLADCEFWPHKYDGEVVGYGTKSPPDAEEGDNAAFRAHASKLSVSPYILYLSRIHEKKGCELLIFSFAECCMDSDLHLVMAGPGDSTYIGSLELLADRLGILGRVHFVGMLEGRAKWGAFRGAECFILPSHQENFGIVVAEALACGIPVLISNKVNIWREVQDYQAGFVEDDTVLGTSVSLRRWLSADGPSRKAMSERAKVLFKEKFDVEVIAPELIAFMDREISSYK